MSTTGICYVRLSRTDMFVCSTISVECSMKFSSSLPLDTNRIESIPTEIASLTNLRILNMSKSLMVPQPFGVLQARMGCESFLILISHDMQVSMPLSPFRVKLVC